MLMYLWLIPLGFVVGAYGTLIGAGGGFVLVPVLLVLYPNEPPQVITSISLAVVFFNALSGSAAYARMGRIDYRSGALFSAASVPGAVLGALTTAYLPRHWFDIIFGTLMIAGAAFLFNRPAEHPGQTQDETAHAAIRHIIEANGAHHTYTYNSALGIAISFCVGFMSSLLGIGGGIIHVPAMVSLLHFPVHIATATSHFVLAVMTLAGTVVHVVTGTFSSGIRRTICLSIGVLLGAQLGAVLSNRMRGHWIIRSLAIVLALVGIRILLQAL